MIGIDDDHFDKIWPWSNVVGLGLFGGVGVGMMMMMGWRIGCRMGCRIDWGVG